MQIEERRCAIIELLKSKQSMAVIDIINTIGDSPATIRRDLNFLEENGYISRTRGYAYYNQPDIVRQIDCSPEILAITKAAATMVNDYDTIMLDSGSATMVLASHLIDKKGLSIVTNSLSVANVLALSDLTVYMAGGVLSGREEALIGAETERFLSTVHASKLFLTTTGVRATAGLSCVTPFQAAVKHAFIQSADKVILLLPQRKLEQDALMVFAEFHEIDVIITSAPIANKQLNAILAKNNVQVVVAPPEI